jgi:hypothetical protein
VTSFKDDALPKNSLEEFLCQKRPNLKINNFFRQRIHHSSIWSLRIKVKGRTSKAESQRTVLNKVDWNSQFFWIVAVSSAALAIGFSGFVCQ